MLCELSEKTGSSSFEARGRISDPLVSQMLEAKASLKELISSVPHQKLNWSLARDFDIEMNVRRDDLIHPLLSGNKVYKLFGHLRDWALQGANKTICSFGGAFSNHLHALAAFGQLSGASTLGVIRGQRPSVMSPTLLDLERMGMRLCFVSREEYKSKANPEFIRKMESDLALTCPGYWIPEGGEGELGQSGCVALGKELSALDYDFIALACGTGTTLIGLLEGLRANAASKSTVIGVSALRNSFELAKKLVQHKHFDDEGSVSTIITNQFHCGGFAKTHPDLVRFMNSFEAETALPLEKVYTGKLFYGLSRMIVKGVIPKGARVLAIHSGGLQGKRDLNG